MGGHAESLAPLWLCESSSEDSHGGRVSRRQDFSRRARSSGERTAWCESEFMMYMHVPRRSLRQDYRIKQRERIDASPVLAEKFPQLKTVTVRLEFFDPAGSTKQGEMKCLLNVAHARSALWFGCPGVECTCGDFDLSEALVQAVAGQRKVATGELRCQGTRKRGDREPVVCGTMLRYKLNLNYDGNKTQARRTGRASHPPAQEETGSRTDPEEVPRAAAV